LERQLERVLKLNPAVKDIINPNSKPGEELGEATDVAN